MPESLFNKVAGLSLVNFEKNLRAHFFESTPPVAASEFVYDEKNSTLVASVSPQHHFIRLPGGWNPYVKYLHKRSIQLTLRDLFLSFTGILQKLEVLYRVVLL